ncbi:MAG: DEAD/DEAH box helicase [Bdellovibrionota bacterium]
MDTFNELNLNPAILRAVKELGFEKPSPIQAQTLPILLGEPTDFIGLAATGTGKTAAFAIPLLERIQPELKRVQAIILCPTRELSLQVAGQVSILGKYLDIKALTIYGGSGYGEQLYGLKQGLPVVVGTPGRIIDHIERGTLKLEEVSTFILDEADEMISMGFREDMETIIAAVKNEDRKTWLFSATMSAPVRKVADKFLKNPKQVQVNRTETLSSTVEQKFYMTQEKNKPEVLCKLIDAAEDFYGVVFCQTKSLVVDLTRYLNERNYKADSLHGDMSQPARESAIAAFRERRKKIIVCTDVAARGLDVKDVSHVVNYSLPREIDSYVHRIGRTARAGKEGIAMSLVTPSHRHLLNKIEHVTKSKFTEGTIPSRKEIGMKKLSFALPKFKEQEQFQRALDLMDADWITTIAAMSPDEVAARFLVMQFPWIFSEKEQPSMNRTDKNAEAREERGGGRGGRGGDRRDFRGGRSGGGRERRDSGDRRDFRGGSRDGGPRGAPRSGGFAKRSEGAERPERSERAERERPRSAGAEAPSFRRKFKRDDRGPSKSRPEERSKR